jgi:hypothetical protein
MLVYIDSYWLESSSAIVGPTGAVGPRGIAGFEYSDTRVGGLEYVPGEIIVYLGVYYICIATNDAVVPTGGAIGVYWDVYSFVGATGATGPTGVVAATSPVSYNASTQTVSIDLSAYDTSSEVTDKINAIVGAAPGTLDTLNELAAALGNDENFSTTVATSIGQKKTEVVSSIGVNTSCVAGYRYITTVASGITLTLPASPSAGDEVQVLDGTGAATSILVARNGNLINGLSEDADLDVAGFAVVFIYTGATFGWRLG